MTRGGEVPAQVTASERAPQRICEGGQACPFKSQEAPVHDFGTWTMENSLQGMSMFPLSQQA